MAVDTKPKGNFLEIIKIRKSFAGMTALQDVSLSVPKGEVVCIIGPSGCGKSTLLRTANWLTPADAGEVRLNGELVGAMPDPRSTSKQARGLNAVRARIGMVFQQFNLWAHMSILQNVMEAPLTVLGRDRAEVERAARGYLEKVGIGDKCDVYPAQLSGGQQQRAAIARALCMEPEALLFDEPTSALDPELEQEVVKVIKDLAAEGRTMVIVTHDMKLAADVSDHVVFLHKGLIEEQGTPEEVFGAPKSERLRGFLSATQPA